ncbi:hypothetical protein HPB51_019300 [Rhipicephalus microplus]|uniref:Uncharacterized protein n=1 Tax=Rhipicephalus microplus TaxID=6941 RepID=A0A9J6EUP0_RHIMP|nr:hypothetical protein HPB51_019300 [Rhipicephalus microplus]
MRPFWRECNSATCASAAEQHITTGLTWWTDNCQSAGVMMVVMEVENNSATYEERYLSSRLPKGCRWNFGFSYYFSWITFCLYVVIGLTFIVCSRKRKGLPGLNDEPQIIGR